MKTAATALAGASLLLLAACGGTEPAATNELDTLNATDEVLVPEDNLTDPALTDPALTDANAAAPDLNAVDTNAAADANLSADGNLTNAQ